MAIRLYMSALTLFFLFLAFRYRGLGLLEARRRLVRLIYLILDAHEHLHCLKADLELLAKIEKKDLRNAALNSKYERHRRKRSRSSCSFFAALVLHELGHYFAARIAGCLIKQAGFGWGPKLYGVRFSDVDCQLRCFRLAHTFRWIWSHFRRARCCNSCLCSAREWYEPGALCSYLGIAFRRAQSRTRDWQFSSVLSTGRLEKRHGDRRNMFGRPSPLVEWVLTLGGGAIALAV